MGWRLVVVLLVLVGNSAWAGSCKVFIQKNGALQGWESFARSSVLPQAHQNAPAVNVIKVKTESKAKQFLDEFTGQSRRSPLNGIRVVSISELSRPAFDRLRVQANKQLKKNCKNKLCPEERPEFSYPSKKICRVSVTNHASRGGNSFDLPLSCNEMFNLYRRDGYHPLTMSVASQLDGC